MFYKTLLKPILFLFDPESVHNLFTYVGEIAGKYQPTRNVVSLMYGYKGKDISRVVDGITYKTPFLLAAGFDYNAKLTNILPSISLAGVEVGSVTAKPCKGNHSPRLRRLPKSKSIVVNKGLRNEGVDKVIERLKKNNEVQPRGSTSKGVVGISIARTNDIGCIDIKSGIDDYVYSFKRLNEENIGDYYTLNISCPNSFGGESFTDPVLLEQLMSEIDKMQCKKPVYVKMPINLEWNKFDELLKVLARHRVNGLVIGNLNKDYNYVAGDPDVPKSYSGGLSGAPCRELSTDLIRKTRFNYGNRFTIFGCGGVMSVADAKEKFEAGADIVQLITGIIYVGPGLMKKLCKSI